MTCIENNIDCSRKGKVSTVSTPPLCSITYCHFIHYKEHSHSCSCYNITAKTNFGKKTARAMGLCLGSETIHLTPRKVVDKENLRWYLN